MKRSTGTFIKFIYCFKKEENEKEEEEEEAEEDHILLVYP